MRIVIVRAAAMLLISLTPVALAAPSGKDRAEKRASLEQKLLGTWKGQTGCAGNFLFRADGTFELTGYGPAPYDSSGNWKVRKDALPATMVLTCTTSELADEVGQTTEVTLIRLDDESLAVKHTNDTVERYARVMK